MKKPVIVLSVIAALSGAGAASCGSGSGTASADTSSTPDTVASAPAETLRQRLRATADKGVMFGHHDDPVYGHTWSGDRGRSDVLETAGDYPAVMSWDLGGLENGDSLNLDGVAFSRIREEVAAQDARGGISTFSWHLRNPVNNADSWTVSDTTIVASMVSDPESLEAFRRQLRRVAGFLSSLTDSAGNRIGVIFRPWHEHTGSWFFWGRDNCSVADYKALWEITRSELDAAGADNLLYAYSPDRVVSREQYLERYPGDGYVDILGTDVYHFNGSGGTDTYLRDASSSLEIVRTLAAEKGKIAAFTETGLESLPIAGWWTSVLLPVLRENPVSYVVVWRNAADKPGHFYAPYPGHPSASSFREFRDDPGVLFVSDL